MFLILFYKYLEIFKKRPTKHAHMRTIYFCLDGFISHLKHPSFTFFCFARTRKRASQNHLGSLYHRYLYRYKIMKRVKRKLKRLKGFYQCYACVRKKLWLEYKITRHEQFRDAYLVLATDSFEL